MNATPVELKQLVLDYLMQTCQLETAQSFAIEALDFDTDSTEEGDGRINHQLRGAAVRKTVMEAILQGHITLAVDVLNSRFPSVLEPASGVFQDLSSSITSLKSVRQSGKAPIVDDPSSRLWSYNRQPFGHAQEASEASTSPIPLSDRILSLDLSIQEVIESVRHASLALQEAQNGAEANGHLSSSGMDDASSNRSGAMSCSSSTSSAFALSSALTQAQALYKQATRIADSRQRAFYQNLLEEVSGLLIYSDLESSPVAHFLDLERRRELAHRLNGAMLEASGSSAQSALDRIAQHASLVWNSLVEVRSKETGTSKAAELAIKGLPKEPFDLGHFIDGELEAVI